MLDIMQTLLAFMVVIGILVTIHEFGHYQVAKWLNVKILRFSIGFGPVIWSKRAGADKTEFALAAIPLGGYVKMLDEREESVPEADVRRAFNRQSLKVRAAIVMAGPAANFLFAILAWATMYMIGISGMKALVGEVVPESTAWLAGLRSGQEIIAVEDEETLRWQSVIQATLNHALDAKSIHYTVLQPDGKEQRLLLDLSDLSLDDIAQGEFFNRSGMFPLRIPLPAKIGEVLADSPAARAGLQPGDEVISVDGQSFNHWHEWAEYISARAQTALQMNIKRGDKIVSVSVTPDRVDGKGRIGVAPAPYQIPPEYLSIERHDPLTAVIAGAQKTLEVSMLTLRIMGKMLMLEVSPRNISGPIGIAQFAGQSAQRGIITFLAFLALVSVSLGVLNLLPIPVLDGGHLLMYLIEAIKGHPLTESTQFMMQRVGLSLLMCLMLFAVFNDLDRLFNQFMPGG